MRTQSVGTIRLWSYLAPKTELAGHLPISSLQTLRKELRVLLKFKTAILLGALLILGSSELEAVTLPGVPAATEEAAKPEPLVQGGLLGAISSSIDDVQDKLDLNENLVDAWRLRADRAADEVDKLVNQPSARSGWSVTGDFLMLSGVWLGTFALLTVLGGLAAKRLILGRWLSTRQRSQDLLGYLMPYTLPAIASLPLTLYVSHFLQASAGRALALCFAYATSSGIFSTSMLLCVIVMFNTGHKRPAVQIIRDYCPKPLFLIGFLAALSDALTSPQIARQLGAISPAASRCSPGCLPRSSSVTWSSVCAGRWRI